MTDAEREARAKRKLSLGETLFMGLFLVLSFGMLWSNETRAGDLLIFLSMCTLTLIWAGILRTGFRAKWAIVNASIVSFYGTIFLGWVAWKLAEAAFALTWPSVTASTFWLLANWWAFVLGVLTVLLARFLVHAGRVLSEGPR